jgi:hypothetical protein
MQALPDLTRLSFEGMLFAVIFPWFWAAIAIIMVAALLMHGRPTLHTRPPARWPELCIPFAFPILILVWAAALDSSLQGRRSGWYWQALGIYGILLLQVVTIVLLLKRHRSRLYSTLVTSALAVWWAVGATFVAGMAVYNDWL